MRARNLGARIRSARNAIGMSQEALGQAMGFATRQPISRIERGVRTVQPDELVQLSGILRRDVDYFICNYRCECNHTSSFPHAVITYSLSRRCGSISLAE